ncbi:hypothetical protein HHI36_006493 [Cryptolaemus montrouzieri]|uniref:PiggyBac transposable element-derived protein 4 C-terminal zinc-ribbon domain-containing protein n=1 Tax=Cryptolaemus montrouzieri TaxID=559131 RepID=A0ABD2NXJ7_9CUCU
MVIFFAILNMSGINAKVIYFGNDRKVIRKEFLKQLSHELVLPQLSRSELTLGMPLNLQNKLKIYQTPGNDEHEEPETTGMKRKRCENCAGPGNKRKLTKYNCKKCKKIVCLTHLDTFCGVCSTDFLAAHSNN